MPTPTTIIKLTEDLQPGDVLLSQDYGGLVSLSVVLSTRTHLEYRGSILVTVLEHGKIDEIETQLGEEFECI